MYNPKPIESFIDKVTKELSSTQYPHLTAGFNLPHYISKD